MLFRFYLPMRRGLRSFRGRSALSFLPQKLSRNSARLRAPLSRALRVAPTFALVLLLLLDCTTALAEPSNLPPEVGFGYGEVLTPRLAALGGSGRATSIGTSALFINPANMAVGQRFHIEAMAQIQPETRRQSFGGAVVDSKTSRISGGLGVTWNTQDPDGVNRRWSDVRFALAVPLGDLVFLGMGGRLLSLSQDGATPFNIDSRFDPVSGGLYEANIINTVTLDAGLTLQPAPGLFIGFTGHNLTNMNNGLVPLTGGIGLGYAESGFTLSADAVVESRSFSQATGRFMGGGEVLVADHYAIRGGYKYDTGLVTHSLTGGLGYIDQRFAIEASAQHGVAGQRSTSILFGFRIHLEGIGVGQ